MKRHVFFLVVGGLLIVGGQLGLSLEIHPSRLAGGTALLSILLQASLALVFGSVLAVTGLLGMADGYQRACGELDHLLEAKAPLGDPGEDDSAVEVTSRDDLHNRTRRFWGAYLRTAGSLCFFMVATFALTASIGDRGYLFYLIGLSAGATVIALACAVLGLGGIGSMRRARQDVTLAVRAFTLQPTRDDEPEADPVARPSRPWRIPHRRMVQPLSHRHGVKRAPSNGNGGIRHYN